MNINTAFPSDYLKAADIPHGRRVTVIIESVSIEKIGSEDQKPVVYFKGKEKGLVLNKTNSNMICEIAKSEETDEWTGVQITLYSAKVDYQGRRVDALRVDYPAAQNQPAQNGYPKRQTREVPALLAADPQGPDLDNDADDTMPF